jgi:lysophospholipase L1-like esterase
MLLLLVFVSGIFIVGAGESSGFLEQQYALAYTSVSDAMLIRTQYSIDYGRAKLSELSQSLEWCKPEFSKQLDIIEQELLNRTIDSYYKVLQTSKTEDINACRANLEELYGSSESFIKSWAITVNGQLDEAISTIPDRQLYNNAVQQINNTVYQLPNTIKAAQNKKLKIAFWGDSITEGMDINPDNSYSQLFVKKVKSILPNVDVKYMNFGLSTRTLAKAINPNYLANNPEHPRDSVLGFTDFWRPWAVQGKSWEQHVVDYKPDMLIIAFGMNDSGDKYAATNFTKNINTLVKYVKEQLPTTDIVIVSTIMPTENKAVYSQSSEYTLQVAYATRVYAISNKIPIIDANRLWYIMLYGRDGIDGKLISKPLYSEYQMLGAVGGGTTGNGMNHPTAMGTYLSYYTAANSIFNSISVGITK